MTDDAPAPSHVFISHSTRDDVVAELCQALSGAGIQVWTDWRRLSPGDDLNDNIRRAIDEARHVVAVLSTNAVNSKWVAAELRYARRVRARRGDGFKVVPVLLPGLEPTAVEWLLGDDLVAVRLRTAPGGVQDALPDLLYALGEAEPERAPAAADGAGEVTAAVAELVVELSEPAIEEDAGKRRAVARAGLIYRPAAAVGEVRSRPFRFTAPWGTIETAGRAPGRRRRRGDCRRSGRRRPIAAHGAPGSAPAARGPPSSDSGVAGRRRWFPGSGVGVGS